MKIAFVFPGFGSQYVGMGKDFYDNYRIVQEYFEEAFNCLDVNFVKLCFASSDEELSQINKACLAIFLTSCSFVSLLREYGVDADLIASYGIGFYAGMFAAGSLNFPDALYLLKKYSNFYQDEVNNLNLRLIKISGITHKDLDNVVDANSNDYHTSIYHSDSEFFIAGELEKIEYLKTELKQKFKIVKLKDMHVGCGVNSSCLCNLTTKFLPYLEKVDFKDLKIPFLSYNLKSIELAKQARKNIIMQIEQPINWLKTMKKLSSYDLIIEIGPGTALAKLLQESYSNVNVVSFNRKSDLEEILKIVESSKKIIHSKETDVPR